MRFEPGRPEHREAVLDLHHEAGWGEDDVVAEPFWVAHEGSDIVGAVELIEESDGRWFVEVVVVRADRRGQGIGGRFLEHVLSTRDVEWWTECRQQRIAFYERAGFTEQPPEAVPPALAYHLLHPSPTEPERHLHFLVRRVGLHGL